MIKNIDEFMNATFGNNYGESTKIMLLCHYLFSRENDTTTSIYEYDRGSSFCNRENYPDLVLYDEVEDDKKVELFYRIDDINEVKELVVANKIFIDNIKKEIYAKDLRPEFSDLLNTIYTKNAFNFEVNYIVNNYISDNDLRELYEVIQKNTDVNIYGNFDVFDKKKLNSKFVGDIEEANNDVASLNYGFRFYNANNAETKLTNTFSYENKNTKVLLCTIEGESLIVCLQKFGDKIFDRNVRYAVTKGSASKTVDDSIRKTIEEEVDNFLIYNNGLTVVAEEIGELDLQNNIVNLKNFSIVNGAQTVSNLAKLWKIPNLRDKIKNTKVIVKIVQPLSKNFDDVVEKITKASNTQKPVMPRDFRSNSPEMVKLKEFFMKNGIILDIKRGENHKKVIEYIEKNFGKEKPQRVMNDVLAQYILSLVLMSPTVANQRKSKLFDDKFYDQIYKNENITDEAIVNCYKFYIHTSKQIRVINEKIVSNDIENVLPLTNRIENWLISLLWAISNNINSLEKIVNANGLKELIGINGVCYNEDDINKFNGFNNGDLFIFIHECYNNISQIYKEVSTEKKVAPSPSAFSFQKDSFEKLIKKMLTSKNIDWVNKKVDELKTLFK